MIYLFVLYFMVTTATAVEGDQKATLKGVWNTVPSKTSE